MSFDENLLFKLGIFTAEIKKEVISLIKPNVKLIELILFVENKIFERGYKPAFPCTICLNEKAAHFTIFDEEIVLKVGDVVKVDFGVKYKGHMTDTALTIEVGSNKYKKLIELNQYALNNVLDNITEFETTADIGKKINSFAKDSGFNTIHNLSGHQIGINNLHMGLHIPNYDNRSKQRLQKSSLYAIEPFFTDGDPLIVEDKPGNILQLKSGRPVRDKIVMNVLNHIKKEYPYLPFSKRWLLNNFEKKVVLRAVRSLKMSGNLYEYNILISKSNSVISQFEESIYFDEDFNPTIITRIRRD